MRSGGVPAEAGGLSNLHSLMEIGSGRLIFMKEGEVGKKTMAIL